MKCKVSFRPKRGTSVVEKSCCKKRQDFSTTKFVETNFSVRNDTIKILNDKLTNKKCGDLLSHQTTNYKPIQTFIISRVHITLPFITVDAMR